MVYGNICGARVRQSLTPTDSFSSVQQKCLRIRDISYDPLIKDSYPQKCPFDPGFGSSPFEHVPSPSNSTPRDHAWQFDPLKILPGMMYSWHERSFAPLCKSLAACCSVFCQSSKRRPIIRPLIMDSAQVYDDHRRLGFS